MLPGDGAIPDPNSSRHKDRNKRDGHMKNVAGFAQRGFGALPSVNKRSVECRRRGTSYRHIPETDRIIRPLLLGLAC